jgi:DNA-binding LytR/AlgR family response regulator
MRIAVVDDEYVFRKQITEEIASLYGREDVSCFHYADGEEIIRSFNNGFELDAVFLDIEMKNVDGMEAAKRIRAFNKDIPIVFMTSHTEMAMDGYEVQAFRFLGKPVEREKLRQTLQDLEKKLKVDEKIVLVKDGEQIVNSISALIYVEASNNSTRFVFTRQTVELRMKFKEACELVDNSSKAFYKCHRSYYINLGRVKKMAAAEVTMDNGQVLPVARSASAEAKQKLFEYVRRTGR